MYQQDWLMRQIFFSIRAVTRLVLKRDFPAYFIKEEAPFSTCDWLHKELVALLLAGEINRAENLLFDYTESGGEGYLAVAVDFYNRLNEMTDEELSAGGFPREEIGEGFEAVKRRFGIVL